MSTLGEWSGCDGGAKYGSALPPAFWQGWLCPTLLFPLVTNPGYQTLPTCRQWQCLQVSDKLGHVLLARNSSQPHHYHRAGTGTGNSIWAYLPNEKGWGAGGGRDHSCTHPCLPETMLAPVPVAGHCCVVGWPRAAPLLCWGNPARWWSHYGLCPHHAKKPSQAINNSSSEGVPWSGHLCAGHGNVISRFVSGTGTREAGGGSWTCVTCCWQLGASVMCGDEAGGGDVEEGPLFQWLVCLDPSFFIVSPVQSVILFLRMCLKSPVLWGRQLSCQWRMVGRCSGGETSGSAAACFPGRDTSWDRGVPEPLWSFSSNQILPKTATAGPCVENVSASPAWGKEQSYSAGQREYLGWRHGAWPDLPPSIPGHCCPPALSSSSPSGWAVGGFSELHFAVGIENQ